MDQEKLAALIKLIMADKRITDLINNKISEGCDLTLIEKRDIFESLPFDCRENVYCQEVRDGGDGFISEATAAKTEWKQIRVYQPSLNFLAKLALGISDEPILGLLQNRIIEGAENIQLIQMSVLSKLKRDSYRQLFLGYLEKIKSYGIRIDDCGSVPSQTLEPQFSTSVKEVGNVSWQYKALTERDLLDIEKGTILMVDKKCIITALAADMARKKSIKICREGEVK